MKKNLILDLFIYNLKLIITYLILNIITACNDEIKSDKQDEFENSKKFEKVEKSKKIESIVKESKKNEMTDKDINIEVHNLRDLLKNNGFDYLEFNEYIKFGTKAIATKYYDGDQFEKIEIKKKIEKEKHSNKIRGNYILTQLIGQVLSNDYDVNRGLVVWVYLPMRARFFLRKSEYFSDSLSAIQIYEIDDGNYSYLTKENTVKSCSFGQAEIINENNGVTYSPERQNTILLLTLKDKIEPLKDLSRYIENYSVEIFFNSPICEKPAMWGLFRRGTSFTSDVTLDCDKIRNRHLMDIISGKEMAQPDYFVVAQKGLIGEELIPEVVTVFITQLRIFNKEGKVIGAYKYKSE